MMEGSNARLFRITFMLNLLVLLLHSLTGVISVPVTTPSIMDVMKNDTKLCNTSKILYESDFTRHCNSVPYPSSPWAGESENLNQFLCLGVYDIAYKICQYSSRLQISPNNTVVFNSYIEKFVPTTHDLKQAEAEAEQEKFCKDNLQDLTLLYNKTNLLLKPLIENLNIPYKCTRICFDFNDKFHPLCAVFAWIKSIDDDVKKLSKAVHNSKTSDVKVSDKKIETQLNGKSSDGKSPKPNTAEMEAEVSDKQKKDDAMPKAHQKNDDVKENNSAAPTTVPVAQTFPEAQAHNQAPHEDTKNNVANIGPQAPPINNAAGNVPNKKVLNDGKAEGFNKKQDVDDLKHSTTLSEIIQDYDAGNPEEDVESNVGDNIDDADDTIPQPPDTGNRNENQQEAFEQKNNLQYSNIKTEEDSNFFTYFTVITLACIAGYIGYHNKQKILAIVLEGRRSRSNRGRRRPSTASYRKLDCTLEEAVTSQCNANVTHVIY